MAKTKKSNVYAQKPKRKYTKKTAPVVAPAAESEELTKVVYPEAVVTPVAATFEPTPVVETPTVVVETNTGLSTIPAENFIPLEPKKKPWWKFWG
jgi:hypothetical protein